jgi:hypothetical protein
MKNYSKEQGVGLNQETFTFLEGGSSRSPVDSCIK